MKFLPTCKNIFSVIKYHHEAAFQSQYWHTFVNLIGPNFPINANGLLIQYFYVKYQDTKCHMRVESIA